MPKRPSAPAPRLPDNLHEILALDHRDKETPTNLIRIAARIFPIAIASDACDVLQDSLIEQGFKYGRHNDWLAGLPDRSLAIPSKTRKKKLVFFAFLPAMFIQEAYRATVGDDQKWGDLHQPTNQDKLLKDLTKQLRRAIRKGRWPAMISDLKRLVLRLVTRERESLRTEQQVSSATLRGKPGRKQKNKEMVEFAVKYLAEHPNATRKEARIAWNQQTGASIKYRAFLKALSDARKKV